MPMFEDRERSFEAKFAHDEEFRFLVAARRDKLFAHRVAGQLGLPDQGAAELAAAALADAGIRRILASPYTRALQTATPVARRPGLPIHVHPVVRERYAFTCDVGTPRSTLAGAWPAHDFSGIEEVWWPQEEEGAEGVIARAARFRHEMAALPDWQHTLVVSHWGFILSMTGLSVNNGQWLRCDPTEPPPAEVVWRHT